MWTDKNIDISHWVDNGGHVVEARAVVNGAPVRGSGMYHESDLLDHPPAVRAVLAEARATADAVLDLGLKATYRALEGVK
jgi:hypothetical protein